jgi:hypothetical protein
MSSHTTEQEEGGMLRRKVDVGLIALLFTMLMQMVGMVWGAAKLSSAVDAQSAQTQEMKSAVQALQSLAVKLDTRVTVLEDRSGRPHAEPQR